MEIQDFPNYLIYPDGRVYNKKRNHFLNPSLGWRGYINVTLSNNGKGQALKLHRLIAIHYIPNPNNYPMIDHIDGNKTNNSIENLRWVTSMVNSNSFQKHRINNRSGHKNISFNKSKKRWKFQKDYYGRIIKKENFKTKTEALCYKYIIQLRIKANHFKIPLPESHHE